MKLIHCNKNIPIEDFIIYIFVTFFLVIYLIVFIYLVKDFMVTTQISKKVNGKIINNNYDINNETYMTGIIFIDVQYPYNKSLTCSKRIWIERMINISKLNEVYPINNNIKLYVEKCDNVSLKYKSNFLYLFFIISYGLILIMCIIRYIYIYHVILSVLMLVIIY